MSILEGISNAGKAIYGLLESGVGRDLSANSILESLQSQGLGYRRQDFLSDIRIISHAEQTWSTIRYVTRDSVPSERLYFNTANPMLTQYQTVVEVRGYDRETGEAITRDVTVHHNTLLTRAELEEDAIAVVEEVSPKIEVEGAMPVQARRSPS